MCLLDTLGVIFHGSQTASSKAVYLWAKHHYAGQGQCTVIGGRFRTVSLFSALCNGTSGHSVEMDDFHKESVIHPGVVVVPAVLAVGEEVGASGKDCLLSLILGYVGTPLLPILQFHRADTVIALGDSTSGCVRSSAQDGLYYGYRMIVPLESVGDRCKEAHEANLFDINAKMADVVSTEEVIAYFRDLG